MPDTMPSQNVPDPISHALPLSPVSPAAARVALDSAPRQHALPEHALASGLPLPPPWPSLEHHPGALAPTNEMPASSEAGEMDGVDDFGFDDDADMEDVFAPRDPNDRRTRPLFTPEQWVSDPDFWESKTLIAITGRHPVPRPKMLDIKPPERFHPASRWRSMLILLIVCLLISGALIGVVEIGRFGMQVLGPTHSATPPVPTHTLVVPTATPHHKK
jgi:hypothetical protein